MSQPEEHHDATIELVQENLSVGARQVETARIRARVHTDVETIDARASLTTQGIDIVRVPIGREVSEIPLVREEEGVTIVPVFEEVLVVEKRLVLKEELHIRRTTTRNEVSQPVTVRRQRIEIQRTPTEQSKE
jgi:stress response protein YsnF